MAIGDDAVAAGMPLVNGAVVKARAIDDEINRTRDFVAQERTARINADSGKADKFSDGAGFARREPGSAHEIGFYTTGDSTLYFRPVPTTADYDRRIASYSDIPSLPSDLARTSQVQAAQSKADQAAGDAIAARQGNLYTDSYNRQLSGTRRTAWLQDNGQLGYAASSQRYKKLIHPEDVTDEQVLQLTLVSYQWKAAVATDDRREMGLIAERLVEAGLGWACFYGDEGVEGINYEMVSLAILPAVQRLIARTHQLEDDLEMAHDSLSARLDALEARA